MRPEAQSLSPAAARALESTLRSRLAGDIHFSVGARALYATDASNYRQTPLGVVLPQTIDDVLETVRTCHEHDVAILPRGAGTSLAGQCCNAAVVMDISRHLRQIVAIDPDRKTARVQPGVVLDDLQQALAPYNLMYGPDPATHAWCTLGGMIGNNSCGVHSVVAGLTADVVEALDVLTSDGQRLTVGRTAPDVITSRGSEPGRTGDIYRGLQELSERYAAEIRTRFPRIPRRVSGFELDALLPERGFNVARALVGSEGTCVTVLEATVRLIDRPRHRMLLVLGFADIFRAADEVMEILEARPIGLEAIDDVIVRNLRKKQKLPRELELLPDGESWLLVEFGQDTVAVFSVLDNELSHDAPIVVLEPSCFAVFKDEAVNLFGEHSRARRIAERTRLFSTFIRPHAERAELSSSTARALVHIHCHQRAIAGIEDTAAALRAAGLEASIPDAGCCGMAGSFGFDKDHYPVSIQAGERVLAAALRELDRNTLDADKPKVHAHIVLGKADGSAHGGHLVEAVVRPTVEIIVTETPTHLRRRFDPASGLPLIDAGGHGT